MVVLREIQNCLYCRFAPLNWRVAVQFVLNDGICFPSSTDLLSMLIQSERVTILACISIDHCGVFLHEQSILGTKISRSAKNKVARRWIFPNGSLGLKISSIYISWLLGLQVLIIKEIVPYRQYLVIAYIYFEAIFRLVSDA